MGRGSPFPVQVKVRRVYQCEPILEYQLNQILKGKQRMRRLTPAQVEQLVQEFLQTNQNASMVDIPKQDIHDPQSSGFNGTFRHKLTLDLPQDPSFQAINRIRGPDDANLKCIMNETGTRVTLLGSGASTLSLSEPPHLLIECSSRDGVNSAIELATDLIGAVKNEYSRFILKKT